MTPAELEQLREERGAMAQRLLDGLRDGAAGGDRNLREAMLYAATVLVAEANHPMLAFIVDEVLEDDEPRSAS